MSALSSYSFRARTQSGELISGTMTASSPEEVSRRLRQEGRVPIEVDAAAGARTETATRLDAEQLRRNELVKRIKRDEVIAFCDQLSIMLETGVPLAEALESFERQGASREFAMVLTQLRGDVCAGATFSEAALKWPRVFPRIMTSLLRASEQSGTLALMLGRISTYLGTERKTLRQVRGALTYPLVMILAGVALSAFLLVFVLPRFASVYEGRAASLPLITDVMLTSSRFVVGYVQYWAPVLAALVVGTVVWSRLPSGRRGCDWLRISLPLIGTLFRQLYLARAARTMATLLGGGVHLLDIIAICRDVTGNHYYDRLWGEIERGVREGKLISATVTGSDLIPGAVVSMIASGERSGRLPDVMERIADFSEQELETRIREVTSWIEPVMVVAMGVMVGGVAIALLLPIFQMGTVVSG